MRAAWIFISWIVFWWLAGLVKMSSLPARYEYRFMNEGGQRAYEGFNLFNDGQGKVWISAVDFVNLIHHLICEYN